MVTKRAARPRAARWEPVRRRFTLAEWDAMIAAGLFAKEERIELIEGEILCMAPIGEPHAMCTSCLIYWFSRRLPETAHVRAQDPIRLAISAPQPDIAIARGLPQRYYRAHPVPDDILLLIEVASSSLGYDREVKLPLYAAAGIVEVWIVDLDRERVFVYRAPRDGAYTRRTIVRRGGTVTPLAFPELALPLDDVLAPRE